MNTVSTMVTANIVMMPAKARIISTKPMPATAMITYIRFSNVFIGLLYYEYHQANKQQQTQEYHDRRCADRNSQNRF